MERPASPGLTARLFSLLSRLLIWYSILTLLFRCPSSQLQLVDSSPRICRPYLAARLHLDPYLDPYYQTYAAPYVAAARPYVDSFHGNVYAPASAFVATTYTKYAAPRVAQARAYGEHEWQRAVRPRIDDLRGKVDGQYQVFVQPHVKQVTAVISPPLETAKRVALHQYSHLVVPSYQKSLPHLQNAYLHSSSFVVNIGVPYSLWLYHGLVVFVQRRVWPPVRIVYGQNVEPQLSRIRERLSSYRDSKNLEAAIDLHDGPPIDVEAESLAEPPPLPSSSSPSSSSALESESTSEFSPDEDAQTTTEPSISASPTPDVDPPPEEQPGKLTLELRRWEAKFAKASDKGGEDLALRVAEITARQVETQAEGLANALVTQLDETAKRALTSLEAVILNSVVALPEIPTAKDYDAAYASVLSAIRSEGTSIREKAQEIRIWKIKYRQETDSLVQAATESTLDVIDNIRDLGLQQIGLRWAAMDDVTYQDWAEYHKLKKSFDDWRVQVQGIASGHEGLAKTRQIGEDVEDRGMEIAQNAAAELARLKDVAKWKIHAHDTSEDFSSRRLPAAAAKIGQIIREKASDVKEFVESVTSTQGVVESVISAASENAVNAALSVSSAVLEPLSRETTTDAFDDDEANDEGGEQENSVDNAGPTINDKEQRVDNVLAAVHRLVSQQEQQEEASSILPTTSEELKAPGVQPTAPERANSPSEPVAASIMSAVTAKIKTKSAEWLDRVQDDAPEDLKEETDTTTTTAVESMISKASSYAVHAKSALSETVLESPEATKDVNPFAAKKSVHSATSDIEERVSQASSEAVSVAQDYESSAESAYGRASATVANTGFILSGDVVDEALSISESIQAKVSEAGEDYSTVTRTLHQMTSETPESTLP